MKKLLFKILFYLLCGSIKLSKNSGYPISIMIHDVPKEYIKGDIEVQEAYSCVNLYDKQLTIFLKENYFTDFPF